MPPSTPARTRSTGRRSRRGDQAELYRNALKAAVADARASAQALAAASNLSLGRISAIVEGGGSSPQPFAAAEKAMDAGSTPIEPGTQQVTAVVSVTFSVSLAVADMSQGQTLGHVRLGRL